MKKKQKKPIAPARKAVIVTALLLAACAVGSIVLYVLTDYLPLLLAGVLQLLPAVLNMLLLLPFGKKREAPLGVSEATEEEPSTEREPGDDVPAPKKKHVLSHAVRRLWQRLCGKCHDFWVDSRSTILATLILLLTVGTNVYFWFMVKQPDRPFALGYHIPVILVAMFVLFIVLDKWCKHTGDIERHTKEEGDEAARKEDPAEVYNRSLLHGLRGGLAAGRLSQLIIAVGLMIKLLGFADWRQAVVVLLALIFAYETLFLIVSLAVRFIRHELATAPELSIPMPGLGGEDLGIISYLEKNTGMTMRSLWSIRLIKQIMPYALMSVVLLLWGFSGLVKIEAYQEGAHYRLGKLQEETLQPGLHMTLPWPFDSVEVYDTEVVSKMTIGYVSEERSDNIWTASHGSEEYRLLLGGGDELVSVNLRVEYRIDDLQAYLRSSASPDALLQAAAYETVTARIINTDLETLLAADRTEFAQGVMDKLVESTEFYDTGLAVVGVVLESIHPPVDVASAYQALVSANIQAKQIELEANGLAKVLLTEARITKIREVSAAEVAKQESIAAANAAMEEFLASATADNAYSETYRYYRVLQAVAEAYANSTLVILGDGVEAPTIWVGGVPLSK